jgi:hypothetical protein
MALQESGEIAFSDINVELGNASDATLSLASDAVRALFGIASGAIKITNGYGASTSLDFQLYELVYTVENPNNYSTAGNDYFTRSAISSYGNYAAVGAYGEDDASGTSSGVVYIIDVTDGSLVDTIENPDPDGASYTDYFGYSVSMYDNRVIIGAYQEDAINTDSGSAYIYKTTLGDWTDTTLERTLVNPNPATGNTDDEFGTSVAINDTYAIVSAPQEYDANPNAGKVYVFSIATGNLERTIDNPNAYSSTSLDEFGNSLAMYGDYLIVGARQEDDAGGSLSGKAYIFDVTTGNLIDTLDNPNAYGTSYGDLFGDRVFIGSNRAIVHAKQEDKSGMSSVGAAYVYKTTLGDWTDTTLEHTITGTNAFSYAGQGSALIDSNYYAIGVPGHQQSDSAEGLVRVYRNGTEVATINNPNTNPMSITDEFGETISSIGDYLIIGAYGEDSTDYNSGRMYIYQKSVRLIDTIDNPTPNSSDEFGKWPSSIAINGNYAIVGAPGEDATATDSGKAYIYKTTTGDWTDATLERTLDNPNTYSTAYGDYFGRGVAINGNYAAVGAYGEDSADYSNPGVAYIFNATTGSLIDTLRHTAAYGTESNNEFGRYLVMTDTYLAVSDRVSDAYTAYSGSVHIYKTTLGDWTDTTFEHTIVNPNDTDYEDTLTDNFAFASMAISGDYLIAGAYLEGTSTTTYSGIAYIFDITDGSLLATLDNPTLSTGDYFGRAVAINGNYAIVGAYGDNATGTNSGVAYIYKTTTGDWTDATLEHTLDDPNAYGTTASDQFGWAVAINDNYALVSAIQERTAGNTYVGAVYMFDISTGDLLHTIDSPLDSSNEYFGYSLAMVDEYAMVGAARSNASGKVHLYKIPN